jgi:hypothetical protein
MVYEIRAVLRGINSKGGGKGAWNVTISPYQGKKGNSEHCNFIKSMHIKLKQHASNLRKIDAKLRMMLVTMF